MPLLRRLASVLTALVVVAATALAHAAPVRTGHVAAELVADRGALVPGATVTVALRLAIDSGWHTYWRNPGESGLPTTLAWRLPPGYRAGDIVWPAPRALPAGPLMNYGYEGEVFHLVPLTVPADAQPGTRATLSARADWLVCKETCIPEGADLALELPVAAESVASKWHDAIDATKAALPRPLPSNWRATATANGPTIALAIVPPPGGTDPGRLQFFANDERRIEASTPQNRRAAQDGGYVLTLPVSHELAGAFARLQGVLTAERGWTGDGQTVKAVMLDPPSRRRRSTPAATSRACPCRSPSRSRSSAGCCST
jgi:DsbC/DsbD-like thiol-disulfide interchange protein